MMSLITLTLALVMSTAALRAHHSIAGMYDRNQAITVDGVVAEFHFVNPHPFVMIDDTAGDTGRWKLELDNRVELVSVGMSAGTLKPGDRVVARGSRARDGSRSMYALRIDRKADGFWYEQVGSSPRVGGSR
jgi:hypothetical protein